MKCGINRFIVKVLKVHLLCFPMVLAWWSVQFIYIRRSSYQWKKNKKRLKQRARRAVVQRKEIQHGRYQIRTARIGITCDKVDWRLKDFAAKVVRRRNPLRPQVQTYSLLLHWLSLLLILVSFLFAHSAVFGKAISLFNWTRYRHTVLQQNYPSNGYGAGLITRAQGIDVHFSVA